MPNYYIAAECDFCCLPENLASDLQVAYDNGASGHFKVIVTRDPGLMVIFERSSEDDAEYVRRAQREGGGSVEDACMRQLAKELQEGSGAPTVARVVKVLADGDAHCWDFGSGVLGSMGAD